MEDADRDRYNSVISTRPLPLGVDRRSPWDRWFLRTIHYWRYGYSHPDEDLLGVIDAVGDALNVHIMAALAELTGDRARKAASIKLQLEAELKKHLPDFSTLLGFEAMINALYPPELARRRRWVVRDRFERVAPPAAIHSWRFAKVASAFAQAREVGQFDAFDGDERREPGAGEASEANASEASAGDASAREASAGDASAREASAGDASAGEGSAGDASTGEGSEARRNAASKDEGAAADGATAGGSGGGAAGAGGGGTPGGGGFGGGGGREGAGFSGGNNDDRGPSSSKQARAAASESDEDDTQTLLGYVHSSYLLAIAREKAVRDLKRWLLMRFWLFLLLSLVALAISGLLLLALGEARYWGLLLGLFLVAVAGRIGATTSVIRRLQTAISGNVLARDPIIELTALRTGKNEISLALLSSSIFALLLYAFFLSGVPALIGFSDGIFPAPARDEQGTIAHSGTGTAKNPEAETKETPLSDKADAADKAADEPAATRQGSAALATQRPIHGELPPVERGWWDSRAGAPPAPVVKLNLKCAAGTDCDPFDDLARRLGLQSAGDFFKLILWAFIAGFAERFVPDMLDRVVTRARARSDSDAAAVIEASRAFEPAAAAPRTPSERAAPA